MTFMLNGNYLSVLSINLKNNKSEQEAMTKIKESLKTLYGIVSPNIPLKIGAKSWTNDQIWKFYVLREGNNLYSGLAKTLLIEKKISKPKDFKKYFSNSPEIEIHSIISEDEFETLSAELM
jgi:hypothetical protein